jgi:hypothetical protein
VKRWPIILGRGGTVLLAVGLALFLVSFIPAGVVGSSPTPVGIDASTWCGYNLAVFAPQQTLTPQQTLHITISTTGVVNVTLLDTTIEAIYNWINDTYHTSITNWSNITYFNGFVKSNPTLIAWQHKLDNGTIDYDYVPTEVVSIDQVNMSLVFSNYGSNPVVVNYAGSVESRVAPTVKVLTLSEFAIPIGVALTLPWLRELVRAKRKRVKTSDDIHTVTLQKNIVRSANIRITCHFRYVDSLNPSARALLTWTCFCDWFCLLKSILPSP